jgi:hypothetical protein
MGARGDPEASAEGFPKVKSAEGFSGPSGSRASGIPQTSETRRKRGAVRRFPESNRREAVAEEL